MQGGRSTLETWGSYGCEVAWPFSTARAGVGLQVWVVGTLELLALFCLAPAGKSGCFSRDLMALEGEVTPVHGQELSLQDTAGDRGGPLTKVVTRALPEATMCATGCRTGKKPHESLVWVSEMKVFFK